MLESSIWVRKEPGDVERAGYGVRPYQGPPAQIVVRIDKLDEEGLSKRMLWHLAYILVLDRDWFMWCWQEQVGPLAEHSRWLYRADH